MADKVRRRELAERFQQTPPQAGVYRIVNQHTGRLLLGSTPNLGGLRNRFEFARATGSPAALEPGVREAIRSQGFESFTFEVLDTIAVTPEMTRAQITADLTTLEALWRERLDPSLLD